jgi:hypothetical protein
MLHVPALMLCAGGVLVTLGLLALDTRLLGDGTMIYPSSHDIFIAAAVGVLVELAAFILAVLQWGHPAGKVAAVTVGVLILLGRYIAFTYAIALT